MRLGKRLMAMLLALVLIAGAVPAQVFAANNKAATVTYEKVDAPVAGEKYLIVYNDQVLSYKGSKFSAVKGTVSGNTITVPKGTTEWTADGTGTVYFKHGSDYLSTKVTWNKKDSTPSAADPVVKAQNTQNAYRLFYDHGALHARGQRYSFTTEYHFFLGLNKSGAWTVTNSTKGDLQNANFALYKRVEEVVPPETTEPEPTTKPTDPDPTTPSTDPTNPTDPKPEPEKPALPEGTSYIKTNTVVPGGQFLIVDPKTGRAMTYVYNEKDKAGEFDSIKGTVEGNVITVKGDEQDYLWTAAQDVHLDKNHVVVEPEIRFTNTHGTGKEIKTGFLTYRNSKVALEAQGAESSGTRFVLEPTGNGQFYLKADSKYLNFDGSWKVGSEPQAFDFYQKVVVVAPGNGQGNIEDNTENNDPLTPEDTPDYPKPGSVRIDKTAQSADFNGTGVAKVELTATGVPMNLGADVVIVIDMSQSMIYDVEDNQTTGVTKLDATQKAAKDFITKLLQNRKDKSASLNNVALVTFNATSVTQYSFDVQKDALTEMKELHTIIDKFHESYTGKYPGNFTTFDPDTAKLKDADGTIVKLESGDKIEQVFKTNKNGEPTEEPRKDADGNNVLQLTGPSVKYWTADGTNYDAAFEAANAELAKLGPVDAKRPRYVVFMTDGAPTFYNGREARDFMEESKAVYPGETDLAKELQKNYRQQKFAQTVIKPDGSAEPHAGAEQAKKVADVFSIGFKMESGSDAFTNIDHKKAILETVSIKPKYYINAKNTNILEQAFNGIASLIQISATNAVVSDTVGDDFSLQMANTIKKDANGGVVTLDPAPMIEVLSYELDTHRNRIPATESVTERVTFNADGTEAYSNLDKAQKNILVNGKIEAHNFTYDVATKTFTWTLGDINEREKVIRYDAYLNGSMEGSRKDGIYPTNKEAHIKYKNFNNKWVTEDYRKPVMPWGSAVVHYEYYLVNSDGKPVNREGTVIEFAERIVLYDGYKELNWNNNTEVSGDVEAQKFLKPGYVLHQPDAVYHVDAVSSGKGSWTINNQKDAAEVGSTKMVYPKTPDTCADTRVAFGVVNNLGLSEDLVILDYNKPITIDVLANDFVPGATLHGLVKDLAGKSPSQSYNQEISNSQNMNGVYGKAEIVEQDKTVDNVTHKVKVVKYSLFDFLDAPEIFYYVTKETDTQVGDTAQTNHYRGQKVTVVPANNVYYEDTFVSGDPTDPNASVAIKYEGNWTVVEEGPNPGGNGGSVEGDPNTDNHGWIPVFGDEMTDSDGVSHKAEFDAQNVAKATFSFTGTGVDIYSRTNNQTGTVAAKIRNADGSIKITKIVDTKSISQGEGQSYYQIPTLTFHEYEDTETGEMKPLPHGEYTVELRVTGAAEGRLVYYLDGIRVYNPIENGHDAYAPDEKNAKFIEVRNVLLDANSFIAGQTDLSGSVFIDQLNDGTDNAPGNPGDTQSVLGVGTYQDLGPKNEVYLKKGQSVAVKVDPAQNNFYQVGLKAPEGKQVTVSLTNGTGKTTKTLSHTADMFYDVAANNGFIIITNTSDSLLSITKLKVTNATTAVNLDTLFQTVTSDEAVAAVYAFSMDPVDPTEPTDPTDPSVPTEPIEPSIPDVDIENPDDEDDEFDDDEFDDDEFDDDEDEDDDEDDEDDEDEDDVDDEDDDEDDEDDEDEDDVDDEDDEDEIDTDSIFSGMKSWF